jgi:transcriptional regulator with XRE-family HTH domain
VNKAILLRRFGTTVRQNRLRLGLSQEAFADRAGLHRTYISLLERGKRNPSLDVLVKLAKTLQVPLCQLLSDLE